MPPRHGKSELVSRWFPAWFLSLWPERNLILTSATDELAETFSGRARDLVAEHGGALGVGLDGEFQSRSRWRTTHGGGVRAAGIGGGIMGQGCDGLIVDDYFKNVEEALSETRRRRIYEWFLSTSSTRLAPGGFIVIVATRWHPKDLIGCLLADAANGGEQYQRIRLPALAEPGDPMGRAVDDPLWPRQFSAAWLSAARQKYIASGYEWMWEALYQQNPPLILDAEMPPEYFGEHVWFVDWPEPSDIVCRVIAVDPSLGKTDKSDYSAIVMLAKDSAGVYWIDADIKRRPSTQIVRDVFWNYGQFRPSAIGCEANGFQELLAGEFQREAGACGYSDAMICQIRNSLAKPVRIRSLTPLLAHQRIKFRRNSPGVQLLLEQLRGFPAAKHDDGPDGLEMAVRLCEQLLGNEVIYTPDNQESVVFA